MIKMSGSVFLISKRGFAFQVKYIVFPDLHHYSKLILVGISSNWC
jgi:hypothetical protein